MTHTDQGAKMAILANSETVGPARREVSRGFSGTYARYVGRVGALAVALGVGAAIAGAPGLAWATPDTTSPAENPGADTAKVDPPSPTGTKAPSPAASPAPKPPANDTPDPTDPIESEPNPPSQSSTTIKQGSSPTVTIGGSGGLNTTVGTDDPPSAAPEPDEPEVPDAPVVSSPNRLSVNKNDNARQTVDQTATPADPITAIASAVVNITKTVIGFAAPATTASPTPTPAPSAMARAAAPTIDAARTTTLAPDTAPEPAGIVTTVTRLVATVLSPFLNPSPDTPAAPVFALTVLAWVRREIETATNKLANPPTDETLTSQTVAPTALARTAAPTTPAPMALAAAPTIMAAAAAPPPPSGLLPTVAAVVTGVGNVVGGILGFLGGIIGGVFNQPPTANPQFTNIDNFGVVTGKLNATDPNGDALSYAVTTQAAKGTVTVVNTVTPTGPAPGTFTYTPTAAARAQAATTPGPDVDTFTITITDARGATTTVTINNAPISPNRAPINGAFTPTNTNPATGVITGTVSATDLDGDTLSYSGPGSTPKATVNVSTAGALTYTPTPAGLHAGGTETFNVTVTDGHGGTLNVPITMTIPTTAITNQNPTGGVFTPTNTNPATGAITGTITGVTDPDNDTLTYTGPATTPKAVVTVNATTGAVTYTPTPTGLHAGGTETFTVTVTDGHGGTLNVPVSLTIPSTATTNQNPTGGVFTPTNTNLTTGAITGTITGVTDPDNDTLTYAAPPSTPKGNIAINTSTGVLTYTPTPAGLQAGGTETFDVTVTDGHGGTLNVPVTVTIPIIANRAPTASPTMNPPNPLNGKVFGNLHVSDPDGDPFTISVTDPPANGTLEIDQLGNFIFTPTAAARQTANLSQGPDTTSFTVVISDGQHNTSVNVEHVVIAPLDAVLVDKIALGVATTNRDIVLTPDGLIYTRSSGNKLAIIDVQNDTTTLVPMPFGAGLGLAVAPDGSRVYLPGSFGTIEVFDTASQTFTTPIVFPGFPQVVSQFASISPDGTRLYVVTRPGGGPITGKVYVVDTTTNTVVTSITTGLNPNSMAMSPDGSRLYVSNGTDGTISVIDTSTNSVISTTPDVFDIALGLAASPVGDKVYGVNNRQLSVLDTATNTVTTPVPLGSPNFPGQGLFFMAVSDDGSRLYLAADNGGNQAQFIVVDTTTYEVVGRVPLDQRPGSVLLSEDGTRAYVNVNDPNGIADPYIAVISLPDD